MSVTVDPVAARALRATPLLSGLSADHIDRLLGAARRATVAQGTRLIVAGEVADDLFIVLRGRFTVLSGGVPIAAIGAGEPIGEIAFFSGDVRSADVVAARSGEVLMLRRADWDGLVRDAPEIGQAILAALARRLAVTSRTAPAMRPIAARCVALIGFPDRLLAPLLAGLRKIGRWDILPPDAADPRALMHTLESAGRKAVLVDPPPDLLHEVDEIFEAVSLADRPTPRARALPPNAVARLVLWRPAGGTEPAGTAAWLDRRPASRHHHVALDRPGDVARLARFVDGSALGLVLSGGGAQGTAHLGALKAMGERGLVFDMVGGTSAGAAMGAALALGRDPDEVMALCEDIFLRRRAMSRYTVPKYSVLDPRLFDAALHFHFGERVIEDLPLPYFAVATSLSKNDMAVLDHGPLWQAVRASASIPAVLPAWIAPGGEVLVDGALIDNAPIRVMRAAKPGPAVLLNLLRSSDWRVSGAYPGYPGRAGVVWQMLSGRLRRRVVDAFPSAITVLTRTLNVNAQRRLRGVDAPGDVLVDIQPLDGMGFLDWTRARAQFEASHADFSRALDTAMAEEFSARDPVALIAAMKHALPWAEALRARETAAAPTRPETRQSD